MEHPGLITLAYDMVFPQPGPYLDFRTGLSVLLLAHELAHQVSREQKTKKGVIHNQLYVQVHSFSFTEELPAIVCCFLRKELPL